MRPFPVDPNSGPRAQFGMRRSVGLSLLLLTACGGGIKAPETIPVPSVAFVPLTPVDTAPAEGTPASPAAAGTQDTRIAPAAPQNVHADVARERMRGDHHGVDILR